MGKPNFSFQKRQKELARQKKKEEKKQRKLEKASSGPGEQDALTGDPAAAESTRSEEGGGEAKDA